MFQLLLSIIVVGLQFTEFAVVQVVEFLKLLFCDISTKIEAKSENNVEHCVERDDGSNKINEVEQEKHRDVIITKCFQTIILKVQIHCFVAPQTNQWHEFAHIKRLTKFPRADANLIGIQWHHFGNV